MTRNTHDRQLDHHANDLTSNIELDGATASYADGDDLQVVISDMDDRIAAGGGGGGYLLEPVFLATTGSNITISTALNNGDQLDGVNMSTGQRILVKDQTNSIQNGIYIVGTSPARSSDWSTTSDPYGMSVAVFAGAVNHETLWLSQASAGEVIGTDDTLFSPISSSGGLTELVTGDSQHFTASLGSWTNSGGTLTRDTSYKMNGATASLKFAVTTSGQYTELPIAGVFLANTEYLAVVFLSNESTSSTFSTDLSFGLFGTDVTTDTVALNTNTGKPYVGNGHFLALAIKWTPSSDRSGVTFRLKANFSSSTTWHIGMLRVWKTPIVGVINAYNRAYTPTTNLSSNDSLSVSPSSMGGLVVTWSGDIFIEDWNSRFGLDLAEVNANLWVEHVPSDMSQEGIDLTVGTDYLGFFISEKDSDTIQFYADFGDYSFEFADGGSRGWRFRSGDDAYAWPAKGMLPQYASAPIGPVEGQSYYDTVLHKSRTWDGSAWQNWW